MGGECKMLSYQDPKMVPPEETLKPSVLESLTLSPNSIVNREWTYNKTQNVGNLEHKNCKETLTFKPLTVMSFNGLARSLVDSKYENNDVDIMSWEQRKHEILAVVKSADCDIVCLQEIDKAELDDYFRAEFDILGYECLYKQKNGDRQDGVCILYRRLRFNLLYKQDVDFAACEPTFDTVQVALVAALEDLETKHVEGIPVSDIYIVSNTHLLFNKNRGDVKLSQLCNLLMAVKDMEKRCLNHLDTLQNQGLKPAIVMCGDFNFTPQSFLYHFLANGYISLNKADAKRISGQYLMYDQVYKTSGMGHYESGITVGNFKPNYLQDVHSCTSGDLEAVFEQVTSIEALRNEPEWLKDSKQSIDSYLELIKVIDDKRLLYCPFKLQSAYNYLDPNLQTDNEPAFTAFHGWQRGCIDYIWYTSNNLIVKAIYEMPSYHQVKLHGNLPNKSWPSSDHFSLVSCFKRL
ncbi:bifunctional Endonuclease-exonuclease-phosphatase superfamily/Endonuclease-exonuclease-phosphatase [Babesia duncani]|uniref:Bifunctional Endonuclease-exonuclease-phosphatase superfamily/Endonuclease-exonuclease-phosphatase n=1 Tax=Babesia duncani TaxID=323732 RepID=A0AAD9UQ22_9APIC|nr:bifunctional Endonuclease-exonuclease-phosphatase superfamily/Endonuclease-exonuclease-phosphatase [Babesia duncani]